jgi:Ser/Thr protein kinase RdoA (MazF antagonist)
MLANSNVMEPYIILDEYDLGIIHRIEESGGTAGRTWKVNTSSGDYFLRMRGIRTSTETRLFFDHGLREHLVKKAIPTVAAILTKTGDRWIRFSGRIYELYPFVEGRPFNPDNVNEITNAAKALAEFHIAASDYIPSLDTKESIAQYIMIGFSQEVSNRIDDPNLQLINMLKIRELVNSDDDRELINRCVSRIKQSMQSYDDAKYRQLSKWIIHGDYTPANLLFFKEDVIGIFDFDWSLCGSRCRDVADGLYFFATETREIVSSDIWSLTDSANFDMDKCLTFLNAYQSIAPLSSYEINYIPWAFIGRWFSIRLEGMAKVSQNERFQFFSRQIEKPLSWLDRNWAYLENQMKGNI